MSESLTPHGRFRFGSLPEAHVTAALAAAVVLIGLLALSPGPVGVYFDDGVYVLLAKALATGHGLHYLNLPGNPPATHFPPGYPLFLAALWRLDPSFPANVALFKFANVALLGVGAALAYRFAVARLPLGRVAAFFAVLFGAGSYLALFLAGWVMSEMLFLVLLVAALWAAERLLDEPTVGRALLVGVLAGLCALTRTLGLAVLPAVLVLAVRRRPRHAAIVLLVSLVVLAPWQLWVSARGGALAPELRGNYGPYLPWLLSGFSAGGPGFLPRMAAQNLVEMGGTLQPLHGLPAAAGAAIAVVAAILLVAGASLAFRRAPATVLSLGLYVLMVVCWAFSPERFLWAVWPLLVLLWAVGVTAVVRWRPAPAWPRAVRAALLLGAAAVAVCQGVTFARVLRGDDPWKVRTETRERGILAGPVVDWVVAHTRPGDVVVTDHGLANLVALYTGREVLPAQDPQPGWMLAEPPLTYHTYYLSRLLQRWNVCCVVVVGPPALEAAIRLATGPSPRLALVARFPVAGGAFAVLGRSFAPPAGGVPGPQH